MEKVKSKPGLRNFFDTSPAEVKAYFEHLVPLLDAFPLDVALAYVFARVELAHNMALYCGLAKLHRADSSLAYRAVQQEHLTREGFKLKYCVVYGEAIPDAVAALIVQAEGVRDKVMHGKGATDDQMRNAIAHVLEYARGLNDCTTKLGGPKPFGDLRGFKGAGQGLEKKTTRWVLKGMGFPM
jgi:hypothetical protein